MNKQEGIREVIAVELAGIDGHEWGALDVYRQSAYLHNANMLACRLHSLGVVIKVDRRPPHRVTEVMRDTEAEKRGYNQAEADMLKAGYVAVEPLVNDD